MTKAAIAKFGGNYLVTFAHALKELYKKATEIECFRTKGWFVLKNEDKFETEAGELYTNIWYECYARDGYVIFVKGC